MKLKVVGLVLLVLLVSAVGVFALLSGPVDQDCFVTGTTCNNLPTTVNVISNSVAPGVCLAPNAVGVFSIGFNEVGETIALAELSLEVDSISGATSYPFAISLFESTVDLENQAAPPPVDITTIAGGNLNSSITLTQASEGVPGTVLTFPTSPEFVTAADAARTGDDRLTVVAIPTTCNGFTGINFKASETGNGGEFLFENNTAVAVDSFSANNSVSPVMGIGLLLVVVLGLGAFVTLRRRDSAAG